MENNYLLLSDDYYEHFDNQKCDLSIYNKAFDINDILTVFIYNPCKTYNLFSESNKDTLNSFNNFFKNLDVTCVNKINSMLKKKINNSTPLQKNAVKYTSFLKININLITKMLKVLHKIIKGDNIKKKNNYNNYNKILELGNKEIRNRMTDVMERCNILISYILNDISTKDISKKLNMTRRSLKNSKIELDNITNYFMKHIESAKICEEMINDDLMMSLFMYVKGYFSNLSIMFKCIAEIVIIFEKAESINLIPEKGPFTLGDPDRERRLERQRELRELERERKSNLEIDRMDRGRVRPKQVNGEISGDGKSLAFGSKSNPLLRGIKYDLQSSFDGINWCTFAQYNMSSLNPDSPKVINNKFVSLGSSWGCCNASGCSIKKDTGKYGCSGVISSNIRNIKSLKYRAVPSKFLPVSTCKTEKELKRELERNKEINEEIESEMERQKELERKFKKAKNIEKPIFLVGENVAIKGTESIISSKLKSNGITLKATSNMKSTGSKDQPVTNLLLNYDKQWYLENVGNKKVYVDFTFSIPVELSSFTFATYTYSSSIGNYKKWSFLYKNNKNKWVPVITYGKTNTGGNAKVFDGDVTKESNINELPLNKLTKETGIKFSPQVSNKWRLEIHPSNKVYVYWVRMFGKPVLPCNYNADCKSLGEVGQNIPGKWMCPGANSHCIQYKPNEVESKVKNVIKYGDVVYLINQYNKTSTIGSCGMDSLCKSNLEISTFKNNSSYLSKSKDWCMFKIQSKKGTKKTGPIKYGDTIQFTMVANDYYLDTCGYNRCNSSSYLSVSAVKPTHKDTTNVTSQWKIMSEGKSGLVSYDDIFKIQSLWGNNGYLNTCGGSRSCKKELSLYDVNVCKLNSSDGKTATSNWKLKKNNLLNTLKSTKWKIIEKSSALVFTYNDIIICGVIPDFRPDENKGGKLFDTIRDNNSPMDSITSGNQKCNGEILYSNGRWSIVDTSIGLCFCHNGYVMGGVKTIGSKGGKFFASTSNGGIDSITTGNDKIGCNKNILLKVGKWNISNVGGYLKFCFNGYTQSGVKCCQRTDGKSGGRFFVAMPAGSTYSYVSKFPPNTNVNTNYIEITRGYYIRKNKGEIRNGRGLYFSGLPMNKNLKFEVSKDGKRWYQFAEYNTNNSKNPKYVDNDYITLGGWWGCTEGTNNCSGVINAKQGTQIDYKYRSWYENFPREIKVKKLEPIVIKHASDPNYCITLADNANRNGQNIILYNVWKNASVNSAQFKSQRWIFEDGYIKHASDRNYCITLAGNENRNGQNIILYNVWKNVSVNSAEFKSQQWIFEDGYIKHVTDRNYCITLAENENKNGQNIILYNVWKNASVNSAEFKSQQWILNNK